jgi:hypothetical protein
MREYQCVRKEKKRKDKRTCARAKRKVYYKICVRG